MDKKWVDFLERVAATGVEAAVGFAAVDLGHLYPAEGIVITAGAALVKNLIGHFIGDKSNGSWLPQPVDNSVDSEFAPVVIGG